MNAKQVITSIMEKEVVRRIPYPSSSNPSKSYTVQVYDDGSTSCNCMGWTRRVAPDGSRSCRHTIDVERSLRPRVSRPVTPGSTLPANRAVQATVARPPVSQPQAARPKLTDYDRKAEAWARANPDKPQAQEILRLLGLS